jgi:hypothetical protein
MARRRLWTGNAAAALALAASLSACVHTRTELVAPLDVAPPPMVVAEPTEVGRKPAGPTAVAMRGVDFHVAPLVVLHVRRLAGELVSVTPGGPVIFDDKRSFVIHVATADVAISSPDLERLLNQYVFAYENAPLIDLRVSTEGDRLRLRGKLRKGGDVPFDIVAAVSTTPAGEIRLRPTSIRVAHVSAGPLLRLVGVRLDRVLDLRGSRGAHVSGNDIYLQPDSALPPPRLRGHVTGVHIDGDALRLTFDEPRLAPTWAEASSPPDESSNYLYMRRGTLRIGRLFMVDADLELVDAAPADPFDFSLDEYRRQLVAGYVKATPSGGLVVHAPDLHTLGPAAAATTAAVRAP